MCPIKRKADVFLVFKVLKARVKLESEKRSSVYRQIMEENTPVMSLLNFAIKKASKDNSL